jgi:hypothetical protein
MTPERMAGLVARWVRLYTRELPAPVAERRVAEVDADLHDHIVHERAHGTGERRIAASIASRMVRGLAADASWRRSSNAKEANMRKPLVRVAIVTALVLLIPAVLMLAGDGGTDWGVFDFVFAGVLVAGTGLLLEAAARRPGSVVFRIAAVAIGIAAIVLGELDDAPGLVLFGLLLIVGAVVLTVRTLQRSS